MASRTSFKSFLLRVSAALVILGNLTCSCFEFSYPTFDTANQADFSFSPGSGIANGSLQITPSTGNISGRSGRVCYVRETLNLWNSNMTAPASFFTEFVLNIQPQNGTVGEGMAFILTNSPALPSDSSGQWLGITNNQTDGATKNRVVAVEFDTRKSFKDDPDGNHVGIDINSINSTYWYPVSNLSIVLSSGSDVWVRIEYDGTAAMLRIQAVQKGHTFQYFWPLDLSRHLLLENLTRFYSFNRRFRCTESDKVMEF